MEPETPPPPLTSRAVSNPFLLESLAELRQNSSGSGILTQRILFDAHSVNNKRSTSPGRPSSYIEQRMQSRSPTRTSPAPKILADKLQPKTVEPTPSSDHGPPGARSSSSLEQQQQTDNTTPIKPQHHISALDRLVSSLVRSPSAALPGVTPAPAPASQPNHAEEPPFAINLTKEVPLPKEQPRPESAPTPTQEAAVPINPQTTIDEALPSEAPIVAAASAVAGEVKPQEPTPSAVVMEAIDLRKHDGGSEAQSENEKLPKSEESAPPARTSTYVSPPSDFIHIHGVPHSVNRHHSSPAPVLLREMMKPHDSAPPPPRSRRRSSAASAVFARSTSVSEDDIQLAVAVAVSAPSVEVSEEEQNHSSDDDENLDASKVPQLRMNELPRQFSAILTRSPVAARLAHQPATPLTPSRGVLAAGPVLSDSDDDEDHKHDETHGEEEHMAPGVQSASAHLAEGPLDSPIPSAHLSNCITDSRSEYDDDDDSSSDEPSDEPHVPELPPPSYEEASQMITPHHHEPDVVIPNQSEVEYDHEHPHSMLSDDAFKKKIEALALPDELVEDVMSMSAEDRQKWYKSLESARHSMPLAPSLEEEPNTPHINRALLTNRGMDKDNIKSGDKHKIKHKSKWRAEEIENDADAEAFLHRMKIVERDRERAASDADSTSEGEHDPREIVFDPLKPEERAAMGGGGGASSSSSSTAVELPPLPKVPSFVAQSSFFQVANKNESMGIDNVKFFGPIRATRGMFMSKHFKRFLKLVEEEHYFEPNVANFRLTLVCTIFALGSLLGSNMLSRVMPRHADMTVLNYAGFTMALMMITLIPFAIPPLWRRMTCLDPSLEEKIIRHSYSRWKKVGLPILGGFVLGATIILWFLVSSISGSQEHYNFALLFTAPQTIIFAGASFIWKEERAYSMSIINSVVLAAGYIFLQWDTSKAFALPAEPVGVALAAAGAMFLSIVYFFILKRSIQVSGIRWTVFTHALISGVTSLVSVVFFFSVSQYTGLQEDYFNRGIDAVYPIVIKVVIGAIWLWSIIGVARWADLLILDFCFVGAIILASTRVYQLITATSVDWQWPLMVGTGLCALFSIILATQVSTVERRAMERDANERSKRNEKIEASKQRAVLDLVSPRDVDEEAGRNDPDPQLPDGPFVSYWNATNVKHAAHSHNPPPQHPKKPRHADNDTLSPPPRAFTMARQPPPASGAAADYDSAAYEMSQVRSQRRPSASSEPSASSGAPAIRFVEPPPLPAAQPQPQIQQAPMYQPPPVQQLPPQGMPEGPVYQQQPPRMHPASTYQQVQMQPIPQHYPMAASPNRYYSSRPFDYPPPPEYQEQLARQQQQYQARLCMGQ